ncbi:transmembrane glucosamine N-acetyltransferase NagX [Colwelliaceae bacterium 6471]
MSTSEELQVVSQRKKSTRLLSIDALRGFDMIWILGAEGVFAALFVLTGHSYFEIVAGQMEHSTWHGFTAYDLIFPLFIFLSGVSIGLSSKPFGSYDKTSRKNKHLSALKRLVLLCGLGIVYNHGWGAGIPMSLDEIRFASVLGRIGIAWYVTTLIVWYCRASMQWWIVCSLLIGYWILLAFVSIEGFGAGNYSSTGALNVWFDQALLPGIHYQHLPIDPEGLLSNMTSIVNALVGAFVGRHIVKLSHVPIRLLRHLLLAALAFLCVGYTWGQIFPINKTLWTSSFVLITLGYSLALLCVFYYLIDVLKIQRVAKILAVIGTNSIVAYLGTSLVNWSYTSTAIFGGVITAFPLSYQQLMAVVFMVLVQWLVLYWLYNRKIFIKV